MNSTTVFAIFDAYVPEPLYWCQFKTTQGYLYKSSLDDPQIRQRLGFIKVLS